MNRIDEWRTEPREICMSRHSGECGRRSRVCQGWWATFKTSGWGRPGSALCSSTTLFGTIEWIGPNTKARVVKLKSKSQIPILEKN